MVYLALAFAGLILAITRGMHVFVILMPIVYVPLTICFLLINARYSTTAQPFVFVFVAVALVELSDRWSARRSSSPTASGRTTIASGRK
jgi:membrane protein implicated in regulation of membrane protease activity